MKRPKFWHPAPKHWGFGFWCSGPESLEGDGLLCYHNLEGQPETMREYHLVVLRQNPVYSLLDYIRKRWGNGGKGTDAGSLTRVKSPRVPSPRTD